MGLFPVFYDDKSVPKSEKVNNEGYTIDFPYLHLSSWEDLKAKLK